MEVHVETSDQPSSTETCPICNIRLVDTYTTGCFFSKGPTQKSSKYGIGPSQQKSPSTLVPPKATRGAKNNQNRRFLTLQ